MAEARFDEEMVHVGPVGIEGGYSLDDTPAHHAEAVCDRLGQQGEHHRDEAESVPAGGRLGDRGVVAENLEDESGQECAEEQGPAVADIYVGFAAKHIVQEERQQGGGADQRENGPAPVSAEPENHTEESTGHNPESAAQAVHAVDEVDGVDDADEGQDGQRHGNRRGDLVDAEQAVEIVDDESASIDEHEGQQDFAAEPRGGAQVQDVIEGAQVEHHAACDNHGEKRLAIEGTLRDKQPGQDAEENGVSSHDGHRLLLEFSLVGSIRDILHLGQLQDVGMYPKRGDEGGDGCNQQCKKRTHGAKIVLY